MKPYLILLACSSLMGCVNAYYETPEGDRIGYTRIGNQSLKLIKKTDEAGNPVLELVQESENAQFVGAIATAIASGAKP